MSERLSHEHEGAVEALRPVMKRILANTGAYAGDYPGDSARRIIAELLAAGWTLREPRRSE